MCSATVEIPQAETVDITLLKTDQDNPNRMTPQQLERLRTSIEKYGFIVPIITNKDLLIADGEQRWIVAKQLNMTRVPVIRLPVEDVDRRLLRQVLNKLRGEHELLADAYEFDRIIQAGHEEDLKQLLLLNDSQIERYLTEIHEPNPETYEIPEIDKIQTDIQRGDIYILGKHRLMCGDATNKQDVEALMNGNKADMVFTDPPYNINLRCIGNPNIFSDDKKDAEYLTFLGQSFDNFIEVTSNPSAFYVKSANRDGNQFKQLLEDRGINFHQWLIWLKDSGALGNSDYLQNYETITYGYRGKHFFYGERGRAKAAEFFHREKETVHVAETPTELVKKTILNSSLKDNIVLDLFGGSGSTLIACEQTNRTCYMMEIEPRYCQIIINRWEHYTNQKATKLVQNCEKPCTPKP